MKSKLWVIETKLGYSILESFTNLTKSLRLHVWMVDPLEYDFTSNTKSSDRTPSKNEGPLLL